MQNEQYPKKNLLSVQMNLSKFRPLTETLREQADKMPEPSSFFRDAMRRFRRNPFGMISLIILCLIIGKN